VGSIPANPDAQNVPSFRRWRFEMKLSPNYSSPLFNNTLCRFNIFFLKWHWQVIVIPMRVNVNLKAVTVEDLIARRKVRDQ
jgi:hypothetical protein